MGRRLVNLFWHVFCNANRLFLLTLGQSWRILDMTNFWLGISNSRITPMAESATSLDACILDQFIKNLSEAYCVYWLVIYWPKLAAISRVLLDDTTLLLFSGVSEGCFDGGFVRINDLLSQRLAITHKQPYSVRNIFICQLLSIFNIQSHTSRRGMLVISISLFIISIIFII